MREYIKKLQSKEEHIRKQIFTGAMVISLSLVGVVWVYGLGVRLGNPDIKTKASEDIKPFKLFSESFSDTYKDVSASVNKVKITKDKINEDININSEKQIDVTAVELPTQ